MHFDGGDGDMRNWATFLAATALAGCGASNDNRSASAPPSADVVELEPNAKQGAGGAAPVEVSIPQLAYAYRLGFRLPGDRVAGVQEAHRDLCDRMGPARCQLLALSRGTADNTASAATLKLRVASADARRFTDAATKRVAESGGRTVDTNVEAEDVSKKIVDAEARIRQRELLVGRLTEILRTRTGKVAELVEAERSVAQAQEELDQAKGWLTELRGRVAMSDIDITYSAIAPSASPGGMGDQLGEAVQASGAGFLLGLRMLLTLAIYFAPWALLAGGVFWIVRRVRRNRAAAAATSAEA
jgi:hypothetical protein